MGKCLRHWLFSVVSFESEYSYCQQFPLFGILIENNHDTLNVLLHFWKSNDVALEVSQSTFTPPACFKIFCSFVQDLLSTAILLYANSTTSYSQVWHWHWHWRKGLAGNVFPSSLTLASPSQWLAGQELHQSVKCSVINATLTVGYFIDCESEPHSLGNKARRKFIKQLNVVPALGGPKFQRRVRSLYSLKLCCHRIR